jgi:DNA excision repair protein ERCC-6
MPPPIPPSPLQQIHEKLKAIRASTTLALKPTPLLRETIMGPDDQPMPFRLRYYQCQGIFHLLVMARMVLGDDTGLGKTIQIIGALCYLWAPDKEPSNKVIVVTPKSALRQWEKEVYRFTTGIKCYVAAGSQEERRAAYEAWAKAPTGPGEDKAILLTNYAILQRDWNFGAQMPRLPNGKPDPKGQITPGLLDRITACVPNLVVVYDEATAFKNNGTKTWQTCSFLSQRAKRCYGMTATLLKNKLEEGFSIYKVVVPALFTTKNAFLNDYCVTKLQAVPGGRKVPIVVGYKNLDRFRDRIDPYFLGRPKTVVSDELPRLITREVSCEMTAAEDAKYKEALSGILALGDGETKDYSETVTLTSLIYTQEIVDSLWLLKFKGGDDISTDMFGEETTKVRDKGSKEEALFDLITGELDDQKVIVYTRFEKLVGRLQAILREEGIESVRVTGKENDKVRQTNRDAFQDFKSSVRVIFITDAGSEAINLQSASAIIFYDAPWSWGNYAQLLGRPLRIGSVHDTVIAFHLVAERPHAKYKNRKTIDHHVLTMLQSKKGLVEKVLGTTPVGALDFGGGDKASRKELLKRLQSDEAAERKGPVEDAEMSVVGSKRKKGQG